MLISSLGLRSDPDFVNILILFYCLNFLHRIKSKTSIFNISEQKFDINFR